MFFFLSLLVPRKKKKISQGILISHFLYNISFPDHPWALSSSQPPHTSASFCYWCSRISFTLFFHFFFFTCKTILFTPRLHKLHFYVSFFILRLFFSSFFHSRILCEMGKNTLLLCKETLNVSLCFFHSLCRSYFSE